jgi:hypothetical protein
MGTGPIIVSRKTDGFAQRTSTQSEIVGEARKNRGRGRHDGSPTLGADAGDTS